MKKNWTYETKSLKAEMAKLNKRILNGLKVNENLQS